MVGQNSQTKEIYVSMYIYLFIIAFGLIFQFFLIFLSNYECYYLHNYNENLCKNSDSNVFIIHAF